MATQPSIVLNRNLTMKDKDMTTPTPTTIRVTRYLAVPALALGLAFGSAAVANALPPWDIGAYDRCMADYTDEELLADADNAARFCCAESDGIWDSKIGKCVAPAVESQGRNPLPSDAPTHVIQPSPLPGQGGDLGPAPGGVLTSSP
jgi:hypothetical protein